MLTAAEYEKARADGTITFDHQTRVKIWAGWYEKTIIRYNGEYAGDITRKRQYKRESYHTGVNGAGAVRQARSLNHGGQKCRRQCRLLGTAKVRELKCQTN